MANNEVDRSLYENYRDIRTIIYDKDRIANPPYISTIRENPAQPWVFL